MKLFENIGVVLITTSFGVIVMFFPLIYVDRGRWIVITVAGVLFGLGVWFMKTKKKL